MGGDPSRACRLACGHRLAGGSPRTRTGRARLLGDACQSPAPPTKSRADPIRRALKHLRQLEHDLVELGIKHTFIGLKRGLENRLAIYEAWSGRPFEGRADAHRELLYMRAIQQWTGPIKGELKASRRADGIADGPTVRYLAVVLAPILGDETPGRAGIAKIITKEKEWRRRIVEKEWQRRNNDTLNAKNNFESVITAAFLLRASFSCTLAGVTTHGSPRSRPSHRRPRKLKAFRQRKRRSRRRWCWCRTPKPIPFRNFARRIAYRKVCTTKFEARLRARKRRALLRKSSSQKKAPPIGAAIERPQQKQHKYKQTADHHIDGRPF